eukprot:Protomagalhaensia_wolfi_Nauph_80__644@NODE_1366_length_1564_cov_12_173115_g1058_i0_p2_GENE_NODE_1366_length_1564_cov_12_173115_g1058_i0NODE_1366_length_1564_cov_12_173115_g1058_i0_p2_ORF_typecomplete_len127_score14_38_NODE_1366_length_1564_cov_12_173115_g1058_i0605985
MGTYTLHEKVTSDYVIFGTIYWKTIQRIHSFIGFTHLLKYQRSLVSQDMWRPSRLTIWWENWNEKEDSVVQLWSDTSRVCFRRRETSFHQADQVDYPPSVDSLHLLAPSFRCVDAYIGGMPFCACL